MLRAFIFFSLVLLVCVPSASADGFRAGEVREALVAAGFGEVASRVASASLPATNIERTLLRREPRALGTTRLGGRPDLPAGVAWPRCRGLRQSFLGQIRVSDLPPEAGELRRLGGTLLFFTVNGSAEDEGRYDVWPGLCSAVIHAKAGAPLTRAAHPRGIVRLKPARLRFRVQPDLPDYALEADRIQAPLRDVALPDYKPWLDFLGTLRGDRRPGHHLLGYAHYTLNPDACTRRADRAKAPWRHLLQIDYDEQIGFDIPDAGWLQIFISPADLRAGRFDRICSVFNTT